MDLTSIVRQFPEKRILVIGDVMLDRTVTGNVQRFSPEAIVPDVEAEEEIVNLGGAGNVAANVASLGGNASLFGFIGADSEGRAIRDLCDRANIQGKFGNCKRTTTKLRIRGKNEKESQQLIRISFEDKSNKFFSSEMREKLLEEASEAEVILISDYAKGTITPELMTELNKYSGKIIADPKPANIGNYKGVLLIKSNRKEARAIAGKEDIEESGKSLVEKLDSNILITLDKEGMIFFPKEKPENHILISTYARDVFDVTGAGDTVNAALGLSWAVSPTYSDAMIIANHAAGIAVEKIGAYTVSRGELESRLALKRNKNINLEDLIKIREEARKVRKRVVFTNGCYDLLHPGHTQFLQTAKSYGDILILALNGDVSPFFKTKGENRPILKEYERIEVLSCLEPINYIIVFNEDSPIELLRKLKPDIKVTGGSYIPDRVAEEDQIVKSYGGECRYIELVGEHSTTKLIEKIKNGKELGALKLGNPY